MASDHDFNRKSFTTGHTGFGMPFITNPDRSDVPRSAARPLRYTDRYVTVNQGEVFFTTEMLVALEGIEEGLPETPPCCSNQHSAGIPEDEIIVVQETEYTGAGKHHQAQLSFARKMGIEIRFGNPEEEIPGKSIILPDSVSKIKARDLDLDQIRTSLIRNATRNAELITASDLEFLVAETNTNREYVKAKLSELHKKWEDANE